jgi:hypothetical protein
MVNLLRLIGNGLTVLHFNRQPFVAFWALDNDFFGRPGGTPLALGERRGQLAWIYGRSRAAMGADDWVHGLLLMDQAHQAKRKPLAMFDKFEVPLDRTSTR